MHWHREHSFSKLRNEWTPRFQTTWNQLHTYVMIQSGPVGKQPVVSNSENCFIIIGNLGEWQSHKHGKLFIIYPLKIKALIYNNQSHLLRSSDYEIIEMIKSHQLLWKVSRICLNRDAAYYTSLTYIYSILTTSQIVLFCKVLFFFYKRNLDAFYMNLHVKWIPPTEWTCVVQLVKRSNINDRLVT